MAQFETYSTDFGEILHQWKIPETPQYARGRLWYIIMSSLALAFAAYALLTANFLFALIIVLFAVMIFMSHNRPPLLLKVAVTDKGVVVNNRLYQYGDLLSFWIIHEPPLVKNLYLGFQSRARPPLALHLDTLEPGEVRATLQKFLSEDTTQKEEPFSDVLWRLLKL